MPRIRQNIQAPIERYRVSLNPQLNAESQLLDQWFGISWGRRQAWARQLLKLGLLARSTGKIRRQHEISSIDMSGLDAQSYSITLTLNRACDDDASLLRQMIQIPTSRHSQWLREVLLDGLALQLQLPSLLSSPQPTPYGMPSVALEAHATHGQADGERMERSKKISWSQRSRRSSQQPVSSKKKAAPQKTLVSVEDDQSPKGGGESLEMTDSNVCGADGSKNDSHTDSVALPTTSANTENSEPELIEVMPVGDEVGLHPIEVESQEIEDPPNPLVEQLGKRLDAAQRKIELRGLFD